MTDGRHKQFLLRLTPQEHERIMTVARECGTTGSDMLRNYISHLLTQAERQAKQKQLEAGYKALATAGGFEDEDLYPSK